MFDPPVWKWEKWFAWYPVHDYLRNETYWLKTIERKYGVRDIFGTFEYAYRPLTDS